MWRDDGEYVFAGGRGISAEFMTVHTTSIRSSETIGPIPPQVATPRGGFYRAGLKRIADIAAVLLALPFVLPFLALITLLIALDGRSPFFRQERIGKDGRRFVMWKFRTMVPDAEAQLAYVLADCENARREWSSTQKLSDDPRVTRIGRMLRRSSLDELPQILNVLKGDMSLIGPRPMIPSQQALYPGHAYYTLRPGMTGSWQVSERHNSAFQDRAKYDDDYARDLSFGMDLRILGKTVAVVLRGTGV